VNARRTWIEPEERCYPSGRQVRKGRAIFPDGSVRAILAGISDTFFTIPAHARIGGRYAAGYLCMGSDVPADLNDDAAWEAYCDSKEEIYFHPRARKVRP